MKINALLLCGLTLIPMSANAGWAYAQPQRTAQSQPKLQQRTLAAKPRRTTANYMESSVSLSASEMRPAALSFELLGRAGLYSLNFDYAVARSVSLGLGFSVLPTIGVSVMAFPIYSNIYFGGSNHRGFVSPGLEIVTAGVEGVGAAAGALAVIGAGYEYRADGGFLFRAAPYVLAGKGGAAVTAGLSIGGAF